MQQNTNDNNNLGAKIKVFMDRHGFYVILFACLAIVGATALLTFNASRAQKPQSDINASDLVQDQEVQQSEDESIEEVIKPSSEQSTATPQLEASPTPAPEKSTSEAAASAKAQIFVSPVEGTVLLEYADDKLIYSKTLDQWTTHQGIDILAPLSTEVTCIANGVVEKVATDSMMGYSITIKHDSGMKSTYANLQELPTFNEGDRVKSGTILGLVGQSALSESADEPHLHFELFDQDKPINPENRLSGLSVLPETGN